MAERIKWLVMDVDGTLTDGRIILGSDGTEYKCFNVRDGYGIHDLLPRAVIIPVIITGRVSSIVDRRCKELGIKHILQGESNKKDAILKIIPPNELGLAAYIGDDLNDIEAMKMIQEYGGIVGCPSNADNQVRSIANYICNCISSDGATREYIDWLLTERDIGGVQYIDDGSDINQNQATEF